MDEPYATIADLRAEGVAEAALPDERALELIRLASRVIDRLTGQWFFPRRVVETQSGSGSTMLHLASLIPILEVETIRVYGEAIPLEEFAVRERYVEWIGQRFFPFFDVAGRHHYVERTRAFFPPDNANVEITGVFGWVERRAAFATVLAGDLAPRATEARVADASGLRPGDAVLVAGRTPFLLSAIDGATIRFDPTAEGCPRGASVVAYGCVPRPVRRACLMIAIRNRHGLGTPAAATPAPDRVLEERTDNYSYRLAPAQIGDLTVEQLLADFVAPPFMGVV